jgi:hypothetical protein
MTKFIFEVEDRRKQFRDVPQATIFALEHGDELFIKTLQYSSSHNAVSLRDGLHAMFSDNMQVEVYTNFKVLG